MRIDKNSKGTILFVYVAALLLGFFTCKFLPNLWLQIIILAILLGFSGFITYFFRVPRTG